MNDSNRSNDWMRSFAADGFAVIREFIAAQELAELMDHLQRFLQETVPKLPREDVFYEEIGDAATLKQIQRVGQHDAWFGELFTSGRLPEIAELVLAGAVVPKNVQYFCKPPGIGLPTPPHQDGYYFMLDPCEALTMWLALDDVDEQNGCVRYVKGSHLRGMREHARTETLGFSQAIADYPTERDLRDEVAVHAKPGDLLLHDAMTIHRADANRSATRTRRALGFVYYSQRARVDGEAHAAYQRKLSKEMKEAGKI